MRKYKISLTKLDDSKIEAFDEVEGSNLIEVCSKLVLLIAKYVREAEEEYANLKSIVDFYRKNIKDEDIPF